MTILRTFQVAAVLCAATLTACGHGADQGSGTTTGGAGSGTGGTGGAGGFTPAAHPALPQVRDFGGPVLKTPKVQPIAYMSDAGLAEIEKFLKELTQTKFWGETTAEYKVGPLTILPTIVRTEAAPKTISDTQLAQDLADNTVGATPPWGKADAGTIYLFLLPAGTTVTDPFGGSGCVDFDGYHLEAAITGSFHVPYAVSCSCTGFDGPKVTDIQERTVAISHELVEAATDPFPNVNPAYTQEDDADIVWTVTSGGEVADMCQFNDDSYFIPSDGTYMIQRSWSNQAAKAGTNPCVPVPTQDPYFNSAPGFTDTIKIMGISTPGVRIPVGGSKTIDVTLFSEAATSGPWKVTASDFNQLTTGTKYLDLSLDSDMGQNGDTLHLTIKVIKADPTYGMEPFVLFSDLNGQSNLWMGVVGQ